VSGLGLEGGHELLVEGDVADAGLEELAYEILDAGDGGGLIGRIEGCKRNIMLIDVSVLH
jgi:hypothetical protein